MSRILARRYGHLISVAVVNSGRMETKRFYDEAEELKLLNRLADTPEQKRFWILEWKWWIANIEILFADEMEDIDG